MPDPLQPTSDALVAALTARWTRDPRGAVSEIHRRYSRRLFEIVCSRISSVLRQALDPADVVQSVFARLLGVEPPKEIRCETDLLAYLSTAAINELRDQDRFHKRKRRDRSAGLSLDGLFEAGGELREACPTPSEVAMGRETHARFLVALSTLPPAQREAYVQSKFIGCTSEEGARRVGAPSAAAFRQNLARAIARLTLAMDCQDVGRSPESSRLATPSRVTSRTE